MELDHEIFSTVILLLPLIQEFQENSVVRLTDITIAFAINQNTRATASYMVRIKNHRQVEVKFFLFPLNLGLSSQVFIRSCCGIVDKLIALQTRGRRFDPWHHQSVGYD